MVLPKFRICSLIASLQFFLCKHKQHSVIASVLIHGFQMVLCIESLVWQNLAIQQEVLGNLADNGFTGKKNHCNSNRSLVMTP